MLPADPMVRCCAKQRMNSRWRSRSSATGASRKREQGMSEQRDPPIEEPGYLAIAIMTGGAEEKLRCEYPSMVGVEVNHETIGGELGIEFAPVGKAALDFNSSSAFKFNLLQPGVGRP